MAITTPEATPRVDVTKSTLWPAELNILFQIGPWETPDKILSEALEALLEKYPDLRQNVAVELYRQDLVSLGRAAEIAGTDRWAFTDILRANGIEIVVEANTPEEMDEMIRNIQAARNR